MKRLILIVIVLSIVSLPVAWGESINVSKHNLSRSGLGSYKVDFVGTQQICIFCHTPHNSVPNQPLWNRYPATIDSSSYKLYTTSATMKNISNRSGITNDSASVLCIGCHDGSPLGGAMLRVQPIDGNSAVIGPDGESGIAAGRSSKIGPNLRNHHPVNFNVTIGGEENGLGDIIIINGQSEMRTKGATIGMPLYKSSRGNNTLECGSCHSAHDPANPAFLRVSMTGNALCLTCHIY